MGIIPHFREQKPFETTSQTSCEKCGLAGIRQVRFHDLRHSYASLLLQQGESLIYVRDQLGHHSIQITVDTYGHLVPGSNRQAADKLDDVEWRSGSKMVATPG